jgi:aminoglycoside phosphotransferase (APT) family kinase protein
MHDDQVQLEPEQAAALILRQFPQFAGERIERLATAGTVNAIFRIGEGHAARFPLRLVDAGECARLLQMEVAAMRELSRYCPVPTPQPLGIGAPGLGFPMPWLVQSWIEGEITTPDAVSGSSVFALDLAALVTALRRADLGGRVFDGRGRGGNLVDHDGWMETCFARSEELLNVPELRRLWAAFRLLAAPAHHVMSHRDLSPPNLLVAGERLVGVLDGGGFGPADPALDLVAAWHLLDGDRRALFRKAIGASPLDWSRSAAWAFEQAMGLIWYYRQSNPTMSALGRSTLARVVEDCPL